MARLNSEYGSELHLLRMLGRHRKSFDAQIQKATGCDSVDWLDFPSGDLRMNKEGEPNWDKEWLGLDFLPSSNPTAAMWKSAWPHHSGVHNRDAVARIKFGTSIEWLLIEAKANLQELRSDCGAKAADSLALIDMTMTKTKTALGVNEKHDWLRGHYQFCNRVAVLDAMNNSGSPAHMVFVYFYGDIGDSGRTCPQERSDWQSALDHQDTHVGLPTSHRLEGRLHKLLVDVQCRTPAN